MKGYTIMTKLQIAVMIGSAKLHLAGTVILLGLVFLSAAHSATYYVKPNSANATCPPSESPCLTLTEYGRNYDQHFNVSDIELKLLPGIHVLEVNFTVANIQHVQLLGNSGSTEVFCTDDVGITFENISELTINGLIFTSCGTHQFSYEYLGTDLHFFVLAGQSIHYSITYLCGLLVFSVQHTMIKNCTFQNSSGTALAVVNSSAVLGNTSFLGNCKKLSVYTCSEGGILAVESSLNFTGTTLFSRNIGGGITAWYYTTVNINGNNTFIHNTGGGISAYEHTIVNMNGNITFLNNIAHFGGGISAYEHTIVNMNGNITFVGNVAGNYHRLPNTYGNGGGICAFTHTIVNINGNTTFIHNTASCGGGIYAFNHTTVNLNGTTTFVNNSGSGFEVASYGGGINAHTHTIVNMNGNTTFVNNVGSYGGGIDASNHAIVNMNGTNTFISNFGGGIHAAYNTIVYLEGSSCFWRNRGQYYFWKLWINAPVIGGGGITIEYNSTLTINKHCSFMNNSADLAGGGVAALKSTLTINGYGYFEGNWGQNGGAISVLESVLTMRGNHTFTKCLADVEGGAVYMNKSRVTFIGETVIYHNRAMDVGGGVYALDSNLTFPDSANFVSNSATTGGGINIRWSSLIFNSGSALKVLNNSAVTGGGIFSDNSALEFNETCTFQANLADTHGAGLYAARSNLRFFGTSYFHYNQATENGGGIYARESSHITLCGGVALEDSTLMDTISSCFASQCSVTTVAVNSFNINQATAIGGGIFALYGTLTLQGKNIFNGNTARSTGGGMYAFDSSLHFLGEITLTNNSAVQYGGGLAATLCKLVSMSGSTNMKWNSAHCGGAMHIDESTVNIDGSTNMEWNSAYSGGVMYIDHSRVDIDGNNCFHENKATSEGGVIYVTRSRVNLNGTNTFNTSMTEERGGTFFITSSNLTFNGNNLFHHSLSIQGAAICASCSKLTFQGNMIFWSNTATYGGAIQLLKSKLVFANHNHHTSIENELSCSEQTNCQRGSKTSYGTGNCFPQGNNFVNNTALKGGALYLDQSSKFYLDPASPLHFKCNVAIESGGAIYVEDVGQHLPGLNSPFRTECFFHILMGQQATHADLKLSFQNNSARKRGSVLYGGLLNKCNFSSVIPYTNTTSAVDVFRGFILYDNERSKTTSISSDPTEVCFCSNNRTECGEKTQTRSVFAGQHFDVSVLAVDQANVPIPTIFYAVLNNENRSYIIENHCTKEEYTFTSANYVNQIMLYPSSVSSETIELTVNIILKDCPPGFQLLNSSGKRDCDHKLQQFTDNCDINTQAVLRTGQGAGNFWVGVSYNNGTYDGLILHRNCPLNYCTRRRKWIHLSDSSEQCDFNHTGLLCDQCREGESSIFGSSQCRRCGNKHLLLLVPFAIAGVSLVVLLFLLNLTVAAGTIHGLIFYANIIASNHHIFLPQDQSKIFTVFISWLNLDLGIETCFYNGMDIFFKTCLQFVFPLYIWALVGALVYISRHSLLVSKLLGINTIPVLATLFYLSYAKILHIILFALSLTSLLYPSGEKIVWLYDANIPSSWYIPLAVAAALFLLFLFLPYTFLLLLGQWLQAKSYVWVFSWANNLNMKAFLDAYHAPYKLKHRYWTGLLLLLRCGLYLVFASNVSGEPSVNLLAISLAVLGVTVMLLFTGRVYKNWTLNALEVSFIVNLGILTAATYHVTVVNQKDNSQVHGSQVATYISISVAFLTFLGILLYHIYLQIKSKMRKFKLHANQIHRDVNLQPEDQDLGNLPLIAPTRSFVQLREPLDLLDPNTP